MAEDFDWSLVQVFLAVAATGSLSGAARRLRSSQPTVGRQIHALEGQVGAPLFERRPRGMALTDAGRALLAPAEAMREAANNLSLAAAGRVDGDAGTVRITASVFMAHHHLPPILASLRSEAPEIQLEIVASDASDNLLFREADIAVRMYRPAQLDVVTRHLGDMALGLYATPAYLARRGTPRAPDDLRQHDIIGYDRSELIIRGMKAEGWNMSREDFPVRTDHHGVYWEFVRAGHGIGFGQCSAADRDPGVRQVLADLPLPGLPVWLTAHEALRRVPRVDRVWRALETGLLPILVPPGRLPPASSA